jgi:hypothetical protein
MALKNFTQFTPQTVLSATDYVVGYRELDEIRTDLDSLTNAISGLLIIKGFTPGGSLGSVRRVSYRYTIGTSSPVNAVSGVDDFGLSLSYTPGQIEVYRNGAHLAESLDYLATNSTQVRNLSTLNLGDIVEVVALSATGVTVIQTLTGAGVISQLNYRYTVPTSLANGAVTVSGPDDFGATLSYVSPNVAVYLNGSHLVNSYDYTATTGTSIILNEPVATGDVVDVQTLSSLGTGAVYGLSAYSGVSRLTAQAGVKGNNTSGVITISADIIGLVSKTSPQAGDQVMLFDVAGNTNKKTTVSTLTSLAAAIPDDVILLQDQKASGTDGGAFTSGAWQTRVLNTEVFDTGNNCTLASNQFTLLAGTYEIYSTAVAGQCDGHQSRLANITDSTYIYGTTLYSSPVNTDIYNTSTINGIFTISTSKTFEIQHRCTTTRTTDGFGLAASLGTNEIYCSVFLRKVA